MKIGEKLKKLRLQNGLTQEELANRCELSKSFISLLERDHTSPSIASLSDLLNILGSNLQEFFTEEKERNVVFTKNDIFEKIDDEKGLKIEWLVPDAQANIMEPILVELRPKAVLYEDEPHEGEEFGYVISGTISLKIGAKVYKINRGESFYFKADISHSIYNNSRTKDAAVLLVSSPPSF
ncbi:MAG: cupin domain-containing protein [Bacillota bacterium]